MPTEEQIQQAIRSVTDQRSFIDGLLRQTLNWPINLDFNDIGEITYELTDEELDTIGLSRDVLIGPVLEMQPLEQTNQQQWGIFILEFANPIPLLTGRGLTGPLRKVLRGLVSNRRNRPSNLPIWDRENLLFICTHNYQHFRFAYFKPAKQKGQAEPLAMFGWEGGDAPRTVCEFNLGHLEWPTDSEDSERWTSEWSKAFDVEKVTNKFYEEYKKLFDAIQGKFIGLTEQEEKKLFAQTLLNRLMFLRFVERKGWLKLDGNPHNYLQRLYQTCSGISQSWYQNRLKVLFFEGLAVPNHGRNEIIGDVPYLNGGLFETTDLDNEVTDIPNEAFEPILGREGLFYRYNFTVEESTPLDIEVAVDPEMLGKVFEKLTNARRQKGSYYTPRTVVSFMCRETLKGYLGTYYASMVDEDDVEQISVPVARDLLGRLAKVRVVDPACGSGAYLLGMLQELFRLTKLLDTRAETETPRDAYQRKLSIIQNNLFGVDLDEFAVNIARLRLWLSLAVEYEGSEPEPLPNLDLKIECGDSLAAPDPSGAGQIDFIRQQQISDLERLKGIHMNPRLRSGYPNLENEIAQLKEQIAVYAHPDESVEGFDWRVEFAEVWSERGGFDIVLANPPYGVDVTDFIRNKYFNQRSENEKGQSKDSYGIFIARGLQLLRPNGTLSYIVSDTWRTIKSHRPLRKRLLETTTVLHVLDLPPWIFEATVNTCILTLSKTPAGDNHTIIAGDLRAIEKDNWKTLSDNLIAVSGHGPDIQTLNCARYTFPQNFIVTYDNLSFFIGLPRLYHLMSNEQFQGLDDIADVKHGLTTGNTRAFIYKLSTATGNYQIANAASIFDLRHSQQLSIDEKQNGFDPARFGNSFLVPYDKGGASDAEEGWLPNYYVPTEYFIDWSRETVNRMKLLPGFRHDGKEYYFKDGITFSHTGFYSPTFRLNAGGVFDTAGSCVFPRNANHKVLLGILNSSLVRYLFKNFINHTVNAAENPVKKIPICELRNVLTERIQLLVETIIRQQRENLRYPYFQREQKEINTLVCQLYALTGEDIREVELWYCRRYPRLAEAQGVLSEVKEKYADHLARCQRILEKPPSYWRSNPILELIAQGESHTLEFKETLEYDVRENRQNRELNKATLKTIAAFLNAEGGTILIGVSDSGEVKGINRDLQYVRGNSRDGFEQKLRSLINDRFDPSPLGFVDIDFQELAEGTVCRVNVRPANTIVHIDNEVYIRDGNVTRKLEGRALTDWIQQKGN